MADLKEENKFIAMANVRVHLLHSAIPEKESGSGWQQSPFWAEAIKVHGWKRVKQREIKNKQIIKQTKKKDKKKREKRKMVEELKGERIRTEKIILLAGNYKKSNN